MSMVKRHFEKIVDDFEQEYLPKHPIQFKNMENDTRLVLAEYVTEISHDEIAAFLEYLSAKIVLSNEIPV